VELEKNLSITNEKFQSADKLVQAAKQVHGKLSETIKISEEKIKNYEIQISSLQTEITNLTFEIKASKENCAGHTKELYILQQTEIELREKVSQCKCAQLQAELDELKAKSAKPATNNINAVKSPTKTEVKEHVKPVKTTPASKLALKHIDVVAEARKKFATLKTVFGMEIVDTVDNRGVTTRAIQEGKAANLAGIVDEDLITALNGNTVTNRDTFKAVVEDSTNPIRPGDSVLVTIKRDGFSQVKRELILPVTAGAAGLNLDALLELRRVGGI